MNRNFTRAEIEAIRIASEEGPLPIGCMGFGVVTFGDLAEQLLAVMDETARLRRALDAELARGRS